MVIKKELRRKVFESRRTLKKLVILYKLQPVNMCRKGSSMLDASAMCAVMSATYKEGKIM